MCGGCGRGLFWLRRLYTDGESRGCADQHLRAPRCQCPRTPGPSSTDVDPAESQFVLSSLREMRPMSSWRYGKAMLSGVLALSLATPLAIVVDLTSSPAVA